MDTSPPTLRDRLGYKRHHGNHGLVPCNPHIGTGNFFVCHSMAKKYRKRLINRALHVCLKHLACFFFEAPCHMCMEYKEKQLSTQLSSTFTSSKLPVIEVMFQVLKNLFSWNYKDKSMANIFTMFESMFSEIVRCPQAEWTCFRLKRESEMHHSLLNIAATYKMPLYNELCLIIIIQKIL